VVRAVSQVDRPDSVLTGRPGSPGVGIGRALVIESAGRRDLETGIERADREQRISGEEMVLFKNVYGRANVQEFIELNKRGWALQYLHEIERHAENDDKANTLFARDVFF